MANLRKLLLLVTLALAASVLALAQDCVDYSHFISSRSATDDLEDARRVALWGDTACVAAEWFGLYLVDVTDPDAPEVTASLKIGDGEFGQGFDVAVRGDVAYVAAGIYGLVAVDLTTLEASALPAVTDTTWSALSVAVDGELACIVITAHSMLQVYSLADPLAPVLVAETPVAPNAWDVAMGDGLIYVTTVNEGLVVYRHDQASGLQPIGASEPFQAFEICVRDGWAFVSERDDIVRILDLADPTAPVVTTVFEFPHWIADVTAGPDRLYLCRVRSRALTVVDVSDRSQPRLLGAEPSLGGTFNGAVVRGDLAYAVGGRYMQIVDLSYEDSPPIRAHVTVEDRIEQLELSGETAVSYLPQVGVLQLYDVSDPDALVSAGSLEVGDVNGSYDLTVDGDIALLAWYQSYIVDISDIQNPTTIADFIPEKYIGTFDHGVAWFADYRIGYWGIDAWDLRDPANPQLLVQIPSWRRYRWLEAVDGYLYACTVFNWGDSFLEIYDVADPSAPALVSSVNLEYGSACAAVRGGMIYMGNDLFMSVVDAAVPSSPVVHPMQRVPASIRDIAIQGSDVWVTSYDCATLLDVSDPTLIRKKTHVLGTGAMLSGIVANDHAFFCGGDGALWSGWPACTEGVPVPDQLPAAALTLIASPNPFNPRVSLRLTLPAAGPAEVTVHDLVGRRIAVLHRGLAPERLDLSWNGRDDHGRAVPAGVYLVYATAGGETTSHKIALIK